MKYIKGGDYLYLVENHRNGKKVYQDTVRYLGRIGGTSKAKGSYNTIHRIYHNEKAPSPEEVALALQKYPFRGANAPSLTPSESGISTTKGAILGGNGTFIKSAKQTTAENWDSKQRVVIL